MTSRVCPVDSRVHKGLVRGEEAGNFIDDPLILQRTDGGEPRLRFELILSISHVREQVILEVRAGCAHAPRGGKDRMPIERIGLIPRKIFPGRDIVVLPGPSAPRPIQTLIGRNYW